MTGEPRIRVADSITKLGPEFRGAVLVAGSHAGRYCGYLAALSGLRGVVLNDAGVGRDEAGVASLDYLEPLGIPAAVVAHTSARIGDGADMVARGRVSRCNRPAAALGCEPGLACREAAERMLAASPITVAAPEYPEARMVLRPGPPAVIACDSASLVVADDAGAILVTGSHGGILAGRPDYGIAAAAAGAVFNDAGIGVDDAGIGRLPVLDRAGIPAVTVAAASARIGDARSAWDHGVVSHVNRCAAGLGATPGISVPGFADLVARARQNAKKNAKS